MKINNISISAKAGTEVLSRLCTLIMVILMAIGCSPDGKSGLELSGSTDVLVFALDEYPAEIDLRAGEISVLLPEDYSVTDLEVTALEVSEGATASMSVGDVIDFSLSRSLRVTHGSLIMDYDILISHEGDDQPEEITADAIFVGLAGAVDYLDDEAKAAATWMLENIDGSRYIPFSDIASGRLTITDCDVIWWHFHLDGGIDNRDKFAAEAESAVSAASVMRGLLNAGTGFVLTRYATYYASYLGVTADENTPNNCWGGNETGSETTAGPWYFNITTGQEAHPLFSGLVNGDVANAVYTCDTGYNITNSTAQWHIGADWGGYATLEDWTRLHGGTALGQGGDGAVVAWEYGSEGSRGRVICIGSGCYDWYSYNYDATNDQYHGNVATLTENAINYVTKH